MNPGTPSSREFGGVGYARGESGPSMTALVGLTEQNDDALALRNAAGNRCDSVKVPGGAHGMGKCASRVPITKHN